MASSPSISRRSSKVSVVVKLVHVVSPFESVAANSLANDVSAVVQLTSGTMIVTLERAIVNESSKQSGILPLWPLLSPSNILLHLCGQNANLLSPGLSIHDRRLTKATPCWQRRNPRERRTE